MNSFWFYMVIALLPLLGGLLGLLFSRAAFVSALATLISFFLAVVGFLMLSTSLEFRLEWLPGFEVSVLVDKATMLLVALVAFISFLVQLFSVEYMREDLGKPRYYAKLGLFVFSMIALLLADNLLLLFIFWELVGLSSYLLIGFWYRKKNVPSSARTAFMVNRVADTALLAGILLLYAETKELSIASQDASFSYLASLLIVIGAFGKSAQFPFSGWLTKAMVGPTPVSALIHAATMVAAGVYLLFRVAPFLHENALLVVAIIGTTTAFYGAVSAVLQFDIKKVLAYSTISQLGYMIMGIGVGAANASLFHLYTHAFFKAGLFLGAASIMHYLHHVHATDAQDMRLMGGLKDRLPWTFRSFLFCGLALAGLPLFSGFMSKDGILLAAWTFANEHGSWAYLIPDIGLITALLTAFYVGRMMLLVFWGKERFANGVMVLESKAIVIPLSILAALSVWVFHDLNPFAHEGWMISLLEVSGAHQSKASLIPFLSMLLAVAGIVLAYSFFKPGTDYMQNVTGAGEPNSKGAALVFNGFYLTHIYQGFGKAMEVVSVRLALLDKKLMDQVIHLTSIGTVIFSKVLALIDRFIVDGPINLIAYLSAFVGKRFAGMSSRDGQTQLGWLLLVVILILIFILFF